MRRGRIVACVTVAFAAGYLLLDPVGRGERAISALAVTWPYLLLGLATAGLLLAVTDPRRLLGPGVLGLSAVAGLAGPAQQLRELLVSLWPVLVAAAGLLWALAGSGRRRAGHVIVVAGTARPVSRDELPALLSATCLLGGIHMDLRDTWFSGDTTIAVTIVLGYVRVVIPDSWPIELDGAPSALLRVDERGRRDNIVTSGSRLRIRPAGGPGFLVLERG